MGYYKKAVRGIGWTGALQGFVRLIGYLRIAVIARVLTPAQFGIYGIASLALAFLEIITQSGINVFLIQGEGKLKDYVNSAWVVSIVRGTLIATILFGGANAISNFFGGSDASLVISLIAFAPFIKGFLNPSIVSFQKDLKFKKQFGLRSSIYLIETIVTIAAVLILKTPESLAYGLIAGAFLELALSFLLFKPRPKFAFEGKRIRNILKRGKWVTMNGFFKYIFEQGDDIFVGKLLGSGSLGLYQAAYKISSLPITEVAEVFRKVTFPVYSKIAGDKKRLKKAFVKTTLLITLLVFPMGLLMYLYPEIVIRIILGPNWLDAAYLLKTLAIFGIFRAIQASFQPLFLAVKKQEYLSLVGLVSALTMVVSIFPLMNLYGALGAVYAGIMGLLGSVPVLLYLTRKVFK